MTRIVAVTGASGFIGTRVIAHLASRGWKVRALARHRPVVVDQAVQSVEIVQGGLADHDAMARLTASAHAVVHLAGLIKARRRADFFEVNAEYAGRLVDHLGDRPQPPKLLLISTLAAREPGLSSYAASKRCGEATLLHANPAMPWTVLRPAGVYGPGDRETLAFFRSVQRGFAPRLGRDDARFSLIHVDDLASAIAVLLDNPSTDRHVLEIDDGTVGGHSWRSLQAAAAAAVGVSSRGIAVPSSVLSLLSGLNLMLTLVPGYVPMLTPDKARELRHCDWVAKSGPIQQLSTWRPMISIDRGFAATVAWYRRAGWL